MFFFDYKNSLLTANELQTNTQKLNYEKMLLITHDQWFQHEVSQTRKTLSIPSQGFKPNHPLKGWHHFIEAKSDEELESQPPEDQIALNKLFDFIKATLEHYYLNNNFSFAIEHYLIFNEVKAPKENYDITFKPKTRNHGHGYVEIKIFDYMEAKDLERLNEQIHSHLKLFQKKSRNRLPEPMENIDEAINFKISKELDPSIENKRYIDVAYDFLENKDVDPTDQKTKALITKESNRIQKRIQRLDERIKNHFPLTTFKFCNPSKTPE